MLKKSKQLTKLTQSSKKIQGQQLKTNLNKTVMQQIKQRHVKMKPKWYFFLASILVGIGLAGCLMITIFFLNHLLFRLRVDRPYDFLGLGPLGWKVFLLRFPWSQLLLSGATLIVGSYLLKKTDFSYRHSYFSIILTLLTVIIVSAFFIDRIGFNERLGERHLRPLYKQKMMEGQGENFLMGQIIEFENEQKFLLKTQDGKAVTVVLAKDIKMPARQKIQKGDWLKIVGDNKNGEFVAKGIFCLHQTPPPQKNEIFSK